MDNIEVLITSLQDDISKVNNKKEQIAIIAKYAKKMTNADRCSLFIFNKEKDQLRSVYADGINGAIALRSNAGIVGYAFHKRESILENNTASSPIFLKAVDLKSGYHTKTILAVPIIDSENKRLGVIQLLNKKEGFSETDKKNIEKFTQIIAKILNSQNEKIQLKVQTKSEEEVNLELLQKRFDDYLADKKLFFMDDGNVYYKILNMIRDYYIAADKCYLLEADPQKIDIYYTTSSDEFLSVPMLVKIDNMADALLISERMNYNFVRYPIEKD